MELLSHTAMLKTGDPAHPENATRLAAILSRLKSSEYNIDLTVERLATRDELRLVHSTAYIDQMLSFDKEYMSLEHEMLIAPSDVESARLAAGIGLELVERVLDGRARSGFALVRPPGHHARPDAGMGFCIFNNIAIAAKRALALGIQRILILDFDVHHGNGTQEAFYDDNRVLFIDIHQDDLFPKHSGSIDEKGKDAGLGFTVNIPLPDSCFDDDYLRVLEKQIKPLALNFKPELILVSAGFDAHEDDPLASMRLSSKGYGQIAKQIKAIANASCDGKCIFFLEGGYNPENLANDVFECIHEFNTTTTS